MLLDHRSLGARFDELLTKASSLDVAIAWITSEQLANKIIQFATLQGRNARVIAGVHDYITSPIALRRLHDSGLVKIGTAISPYKFHPKLYLFTVGGKHLCWIGSVNLTNAGFAGNIELVHEHVDDGSAAEWFDSQWRAFKHPDIEWLDEYEQRAACEAATRPARAQMHAPEAPGGPLDSWNGFVAALTRANDKWIAKHDARYNVFDGTTSYVGVIRAAQPVLRKDWESLSAKGGRILMGLIDEDGTNYGLLGSMQGAGTAVNVFLEPSYKNLKTRQDIQESLKALMRAALNDSFPLIARRTHEIITNREGFDSGVATRLMTLARPEALVSVNSESSSGLAEMSGLSTGTIKSSTGYEKLVKWIMQSKWWNVPPPEDSLEQELWSYRAALIDALIYEGH
jgi:HKD family nuclease